MAVSDALVVGEAWISEHYFTTDAKNQSFQARVLERRKLWDQDKDHGTTRTRFTSRRSQLLGTFATLQPRDERLPELYRTIESILGYDRAGLTRDRVGPVSRIHAAGLTGDAPLAIVHAVAVDSVEDLLNKDKTTLLEAYEPDDSTSLKSVARTVSHLFTSADHPEFVLVLAGRLALIAERERWAEGRYLLVDLQLVCERNDDKRGGEVDRALTCLDAASLAPDADGEIWWTGPLEESVRHTVGVSKDLREGVRLSIEIIANDVVARRREQGLEPLPADQAQMLARQSLRFLYRVLFLLYAEASPELGVLPVGAPEYDRGYSLDRLRDLTLVELTTPRSQNGTHLYDSLDVLFSLVDQGHAVPQDDDSVLSGLEFQSLRADLFLPSAVDLIRSTKLGNHALQQVLRHLLLSKESKGRDRGFISYAELGINQLGAVYEGLMSYTGFFAETDLYEVAKGGDASKGSWVVPVHRADDIAAADFVMTTDEYTGETKRVLHRAGTFVYRLAGRERQQSASYYTPEVLTRFTVSQALEELLDQGGHRTTAEEILGLTVCEPALGSGAFAIEAVRQLAEHYLTRRQEELGERIDPDDYPRELQRVKAYIALHNVYGVDLNSTAVELAEISLWLDTMVEGLEAPWFGLHLRRGNSLIGARRAVYSVGQVEKKTWLKDVPRDVSFSDITSGSVHHFLLPAEGWGSAVEAKEAKSLTPDALAELKAWRKSVFRKPTKKEVTALLDVARRVETLWEIALERLRIAEREVRRSIDVWGWEAEATTGAVTREEIERKLADADGAYRRLRRVMDAWNALWFWPLTDELTTVELAGELRRVDPPTFDQWLDALVAIVGTTPPSSARGKRAPGEGQLGLETGGDWSSLGQVEELDLDFAQARPIEKVLADHPWLVVCERIAEQHGFFHWELDFAPVFHGGGFDLQVGNPPWVRPRSDVDALLAEGDPWWQLAVKPTQAQVSEKREQTLALPGIEQLVVNGTTDVACTAAFVGSPLEYPHLKGLQPDLYRCFMEQTWRHQSGIGTIALIHPETHFTDEKAGLLREPTYLRLRRHWHFLNEQMLFEIDDKAFFGVHVYGTLKDKPGFELATYIYHPDVVTRSYAHDGSGEEPGLKDPEGNWDLRPHADRIITVTDDVLATWHAVLENDDVPVRRSRMVYAVNRSTAEVLAKLASAPRLGELGLEFSAGWHEKNDRTKGFFDSEWGRPDSWDDVILQGPHLFVNTPMYKSPNRTMLHNQDWSATDFETLPADAIPITSYKPRGDRARYDASYTHWGDDARDPARAHYRLAWRKMAANTGERTLISAIIPPGSAHIDGVYSFRVPDSSVRTLLGIAAKLSSLVLDFAVRVAPKSNIRAGVIGRLPFVSTHPLLDCLTLRAARMTCVANAWEPLWVGAWNEGWITDAWAGGFEYEGRPPLAYGRNWTTSAPLRLASDRRQAQVEIDAIVALMLGLTADELCTIYRTQFSVLYGYDRNTYFYDRNGRLVPNSVLTVWRKKGDAINEEERTATNQAGNTYTYELPFATLDREADMRQAYAHFEKILQERS
ncbi:class I SAM-dependent DNA methyltransferase [Aeromicrobium senzhongii]|uniref:site-specific DNA-methyltransferase (adenine-specific) n=1 Tax=Aeromicrobium senzhongii TaxID=2663859 RepID=A0ABX6SRK0_9ACTN|nr:class I SAM-dependent DNA methyltransferase [Aeromicrobium senzhongii]MTB89048.1 class I SAM-dependent DNA methyltransferase [Aeromicrobium senzhongii]QNL93681.1 class I SAM-dependent DNA methyltransferase [Aeromicrobium senzhongii]